MFLVVLLIEFELVKYGVEIETLWHYDDYSCQDVFSNCRMKSNRVWENP